MILNHLTELFYIRKEILFNIILSFIETKHSYAVLCLFFDSFIGFYAFPTDYLIAEIDPDHFFEWSLHEAPIW